MSTQEHALYGASDKTVFQQLKKNPYLLGLASVSVHTLNLYFAH